MSTVYQNGEPDLDKIFFRPLFAWYLQDIYDWFERHNMGNPFEVFRRLVLTEGPPKTKSGDVHHDSGHVFHRFVIWGNEQFAQARGMSTRPYSRGPVSLYPYPLTEAHPQDGNVVVTKKNGPVNIRHVVTDELGRVTATDAKGEKVLELDAIYILKTPSSSTAIGVENTIKPKDDETLRYEQRREFLANLLGSSVGSSAFTEPYTLRIRPRTDRESIGFHDYENPRHRKLVIPGMKEIRKIETELYGRV